MFEEPVMSIQIDLLNEYREGGCVVSDDPHLLTLHDWELELAEERGDHYDVVNLAVSELLFNGITVFDRPNEAHSGDDSWVRSEEREGDYYRGRARLIGFTDDQLGQIRARVAAGPEAPRATRPDPEERPNCLGTGIPDLKAAKRYLRRKFTQGRPEEIIQRPGARFYVTARIGRHTYALLGPYVSHMTALAAIPRAERLLTAAEVGEPDPDVSFQGMYPFARLHPFTALGTASAPVTVPTVFGR
jgi:hypothetical protein